MNQSTVLSTRKAIINGKAVKVETIKLTPHRAQDIAYKVAGNLLTSTQFWNLGPKFRN